MIDLAVLPASLDLTIATPAAVPDPDPTFDLRELRTLAQPGMRVVIAFTDATRACPDELLVGALLRELRACGVGRDAITLLCAVGLHRPSTRAERLAKLGAAICAEYAIVDHDASDPTQLVDLGEVNDIPVVVNRRCVEADLLLATGVVEPHQYAGFSGGSKTVAIGCGGAATIAATHGIAMLDRPGVALGSVAGNPFQQFVRAAGARVGLRFVVNTLLDARAVPVRVLAGAPDEVHDALMATARLACEVRVARPAQLVIADASGPKGVNLYQASRAASYLALCEGSALLPGAPIVLIAPIPEGAGDGAGEQAFLRLLSGSAPQVLIDQLRRDGFPGGGQRAFIMAQVLVRHPLIVVGAAHPDVVRACHMIPANTLDQGLAIAEHLARQAFGIAPGAQIAALLVPRPLQTLVRLGA